MSSYKVDSKTNLPILYLKDTKEALWKKFESTYPDGIKRTTFIARLADGPYMCIEKILVDYAAFVMNIFMKFLVHLIA